MVRGLSFRVCRMPHGGAAPGVELLTHADEHLVRCRTHERNQLGAILQIHRAYAVMGLGIGRAVPVKVGAPGPPAIAAVLANADLGVGRVVSARHRPELAADWQLPANVWL